MSVPAYESEYFIPGLIAGRERGENEIVNSGIYNANYAPCGFPKLFATGTDHGGIKHCVAGLEFRRVIATFDFTA